MSADALDREKLARILGMLGSAHDGEVAAAGRAADRLIREAGLRWPDVVQPALSKPIDPPDARTSRQAILFCLGYSFLLSEWERSFLTTLSEQRHPISEKQGVILDQIVEKIRRACARAA